MTQQDNDDNGFMPIIQIEDSDVDFDELAIKSIPEYLPFMPLRNTVVFPGIIMPISLGREKSINAVVAANEMEGRLLVVATQLDSETEEPISKHLHKVGTLAKVLKLIKMPDGQLTAIIQGRERVSFNLARNEGFWKAEPFRLREVKPKDKAHYDALLEFIREEALEMAQKNPNIPQEGETMLRNIKSRRFLINFLASNLPIDLPAKQSILSESKLMVRAELLLNILRQEHNLLNLRNKIEEKVKTDLDKQQRDYFLSHQIKVINEELGNASPEGEIEKLIERSASVKLTEQALTVFNKEISKLKRTPPGSPDHSVSFNYLEVLLDLPWGVYTEDNFDLKAIEQVLNEDHFGMEKIKQRIIEHIAVLKLRKDMKAPIICLVGPPGIGKTSLGKSIARALNRQYLRIALGGVHDEAEIRGHRKTYIGAMPGKIISSLRRAKTSNPVFLLDEIDKINRDLRGDPSSALLEALDPEQNTNFTDNYLDVDYDLSKVLFIATANSLSTIQPALLDRMEIIDLEGYAIEEKIQIAIKHLLPQELETHGLEAKHLTITPKMLEFIIQRYTRESGVRELKRVLSSIMRHTAQKIALNEKVHELIETEADVKAILSWPKYHPEDNFDFVPAGVAVGLAWTQVGGEILFIETATMPGDGKLTLTGSLGDVMKESAITAHTYLLSNATALGLDYNTLKQQNLHSHIPAGAIPKDGPSAGITLMSSFYSAYTQKPLKKDLAMTGEITLRGKVLPVGGIKEKVLAAKRAGVKEIIMSKDNERDILEISATYLDGLKFHYVSNIGQVITAAFG